jgi:predicted nucleotidyltransferase
MLNPDFKEFIKSLNDKNVQYIIVGGYALAFHGHPRYTKDLDIWIKADAQNAKNMVEALEQFGFASIDLKEEDFLQADQMIQLGYPPSRIDILTYADGINFEDCYEVRMITQIDDVIVNFIDRENLIINKRATGRTQDIADAEKLQ